MKSLLFFGALAAALVFSAPSHTAQAKDDNAIRVSTVLHPDGSRTVTRFDPAKRTTESSRYNGEKLVQRTVFKLNFLNQPESGLVYNAKNVLVHRIKIVRDESGRVKEEIRNTPGGKFLARLVYRYDAKGRVRKIDAFDAQGKRLKQKH
jgi:hypothetical protein